MRNRRKPDPIQRHHLEYQEGEFKDKEGEVVLLFRSEHFLITKMQWRKTISKGFIKALRHWIRENEEDAVDLQAEREEEKRYVKAMGEHKPEYKEVAKFI